VGAPVRLEDAQPAEQDSDEDRERPEQYFASEKHHDPDDYQDQSDDYDQRCGAAMHNTGQQQLQT
jgi:hypothetical protein